jgi:hypothetical protein
LKPFTYKDSSRQRLELVLAESESSIGCKKLIYCRMQRVEPFQAAEQGALRILWKAKTLGTARCEDEIWKKRSCNKA